MAVQIGSLYVQLTMDTNPFVTGMERAAGATASGAAQINRNLGLTRASVNGLSRAFNNANGFRPYAIIAASRSYETAADRANLLRGSLLAVTAVAGGFATALGSNLVSRYLDTVVNLDNQLRTVTTSSANLEAVQEDLEGVAGRSRASIQSTITLYARMARATDTLGLSQDKLARITETVQKAFSIGGATAGEAAGAALQLSQGIASDRFSGDEYRSVAENAPVLLRAIAASMGVTIGQLRKLSTEGALTAQTVTEAILKSSATIDAEFAKTVPSIDRAITQVDNKLIEYTDRVNKAYGVTGLLSSGILTFANNLDQIVPGVANVGAIVGAALLARNKGALGAGLGALAGGGIGGLFGGTQGAVSGALIGGFFGNAATRSNERGLNLIQQIRENAREAKAEVVALEAEQTKLRSQTLAAGLATNQLRRAAEGGVTQFAPAGDRAAVDRAEAALAKTQQQLSTAVDKTTQAYANLDSIRTRISPRAATLADAQVKAEQKLNETLAREADLRNRLAQVNAAVANVAPGTAAAGDVEKLTKQRIALEQQLGTVESSIARQRQGIADRDARISSLAAEADRKAAEQRIAAQRVIVSQLTQVSDLEVLQAKQEQALAEARRAAQQAGAAAAKEQLAQSAATYRALGQNLSQVETQLGAARRAATPLGQALSFVRQQGNSLVNLFGGPWGVAITAASLAFAKFAADAQARAQSIANARSIIQEVADEEIVPKLEGSGAGSITSIEIEKLKDKIKAVKEGGDDAVNTLRGLLNINPLTSANQDPISQIKAGIESLLKAPIQPFLDKLANITGVFINGGSTVDEFNAQVAELEKQANSADFTNIAEQMLPLANQLAATGKTIDALNGKVKNLQDTAKDPITIEVDVALNQRTDPKLKGALDLYAKGQAFVGDLHSQLSTLRLTGDAQKVQSIIDDETKKAAKIYGDQIPAAIKKEIAAFAQEKVALENRDATLKKSDSFTRAIADVEKHTAQVQAETAAIGQGTYATVRATTVAQLENAAKEDSIGLTTERTRKISEEADAAAAAARTQEQLTKAQQQADEELGFYRDSFAGLFTTLRSNLRQGENWWDAFADAAIDAMGNITDHLLTLVANKAFDTIFGTASNSPGGASSGFLGNAISSAVSFLTNGGGQPGVAGTTFAPSLFASGGEVRGIGTATSDSNLARLSKGEFVVNAAATRRYLGLLSAINDNRLPAMATGGVFGGASPFLPDLRPFVQAAANGNEAPTVVIEDHVGANIETKREKSPNGRDLLRFVITAVADDTASPGGKINRTQRLAFGARQQLTRR